jgi:hypothetical protein
MEEAGDDRPRRTEAEIAPRAVTAPGPIAPPTGMTPSHAVRHRLVDDLIVEAQDRVIDPESTSTLGEALGASR